MARLWRRTALSCLVLLLAASARAEVPVGPIISFGGQHRLLYRHAQPAGLGLEDQPAQGGVMLLRSLLHVDVGLPPALRLFAQLGSYQALGDRVRPTPPSADDADLAQLFVEMRVPFDGGSLALRLGRQELGLGSTRWFSVRDGANMRLSFDLLRLTVRFQELTVELFAGLEQRLGRQAFDNRSDWQRRLWGTYQTLHLLPDGLLSLELFYVGRLRERLQSPEIFGRETRHTLGLRLFGETGFGLGYIQHGLVQIGQHGQAHILAWGLSGALWQRLFAEPVRLRSGVRWDVLSGDRRMGDGRLGTFDPLFPNPTFFSALPLFYPSNVVALHPLVDLAWGTLSGELGCAFFWRQSASEGVQGVDGGRVLIEPRDSRARYTGAQLSGSLEYQIDAHFTADVAYSYVFAGAAIAESGGADMAFFGSSLRITY